MWHEMRRRDEEMKQMDAASREVKSHIMSGSEAQWRNSLQKHMEEKDISALVLQLNAMRDSLRTQAIDVANLRQACSNSNSPSSMPLYYLLFTILLMRRRRCTTKED